MVKLLLKISGTIILLAIVFLVWLDQSRSFYCLSEDKCVTVWKRLGNKCFIIPGKYYGVLSPTVEHIRTTNNQYLTLYFADDLPGRIIVRNQSDSEREGYEIVESSKGRLGFVEYTDDLKMILYKPGAKKFSDVVRTANYMDLDIKENYAIDKKGDKL